jgi:peptidoglycan/LPS O-acetylase OafA/YrhL
VVLDAASDVDGRHRRVGEQVLPAGSAARQSPGEYFAFVDGLRAVAIVAVMAYHAVPPWLPGGYAGVDVFFVISGFLITRQIAADLDLGQFSLARFFARRARRLLPAAAVCFAVVFGLSACVLLPDAFVDFGRSLMAAALSYANFYFYVRFGYFAGPSVEKPLLHIWSLAVEDQFYLTWPLLLMFLTRQLRKPAVIAATCAVFAASLALSQACLASNPEFAFYMLPARAWELLAGALIALLPQPIRLSKAAAEALAAAGITSIAASFYLLSKSTPFPGLSAVPVVMGTVSVIVAGLGRTTAVTSVLAWRPVVFTGAISYSLYLWHWPLLALIAYRLERSLTPGEAIAVLGVAFGLAILSWRHIERPFRTSHKMPHGASVNADRPFVFGALVAVVLLTAVGGHIKGTKGWLWRYGPQVQPLFVQLESSNPYRESCDNYDNVLRHDGICNFGRRKEEGASYDVALFGDSMADQWTPMMAKAAASRNMSGRQVTNGGCAFFAATAVPAESALKTQECASYQKAALDFIAANPHLKLAVLASYWELWLSRLDTEREGHFEAALTETVAAFTSRGVKVVLIGQPPSYSQLPLRCVLAKITDRTDPNLCGKARDDGIAALHNSDAVLSRIAAADPLVGVRLPSDFMCTGARCALVLDGTLLYRDARHLNRFGAEYLGRYVLLPDGL